MSIDKESGVSFPPMAKESFRERLESLLKGRSVRVASQAWGIPASTINNYLHKGTEPALRVVVAIAEAEGVSLEWLGLGLNKEHEGATYKTKKEGNSDPLKVVWDMIYDSISRSEAETLIKLIHSNGARGVIASASLSDDMSRQLHELPDDEKARLLALHEAKKGASEGREMNEPTNPATDKRQVG